MAPRASFTVYTGGAKSPQQKDSGSTSLPRHGLFLSLVILALWGIWAFIPKLALQTLSPQSVVFYETLAGLFCSCTAMLVFRARLEVHAKGIGIIAIAASLTVLALLTYFVALNRGSVAVVVTISGMYPVIVLVLARIFLKEKLNRMQLAAAALAVTSIILLAAE